MDGHVLCTLPFTSYYIKIKKPRLIFSKQINTAENISSRLIWISVKENKKNISKLKQGLPAQHLVLQLLYIFLWGNSGQVKKEIY